MRMKIKSQGFTLLELIIVIIVVGVLASIAMPRLFKSVEFSRSTEAMNSLTGIRGAIERCYSTYGGNYTPCNNWPILKFENPSSAVGSHFNYNITIDSNNTYRVTARRNTYNGGSGDPSDYVMIRQTATEVLLIGGGVYSSIQP